MYQHTLQRPCHIQGVGLHSGKKTQVSLLPAPAHAGVTFRVKSNGRQVEIPARSEFVIATRLNTTLGRDNLQVCTVEHLLAALAGLEIDNCIVVTHGHEVPAMDGSAQPFVSRILEAGRRTQPVPRQMLRILKPICVEEGDRFAGLYPALTPTFAFVIDFDNPAIQTQSFKLCLTRQSFVGELARARTFGFIDELQELQQNGLALGAGLQNAVGLSRAGQVMNEDGLRYPDEFVRHKVLDAIGDLYLAGYPLLGEYRGIKSGHALHRKLLDKLAEQPKSWEVTPALAEQEAFAV